MKIKIEMDVNMVDGGWYGVGKCTPDEPWLNKIAKKVAKQIAKRVLNGYLNLDEDYEEDNY